MSKHTYKITEYENELGDVYYTVKSSSIFWFCSSWTLGNNKHAKAWIDNKVPKPYDTAEVNYLYIFTSLKDAYKAIKEDKHERAANNFKKKNVIEVNDEDN